MIELEAVFGNREKRQYGLLSNIAYNLRQCYEFDKRMFYFQVLPIVPAVAAAYLGTLIPSEVVRALQEQWDMRRMVQYICVLSLIMLLCNMLVSGMNVYVNKCSYLLSIHFAKKCFHKTMHLDYDLLEKEEEQKLIGNAWQSIRNSYNFFMACETVPVSMISLGSVVFYGILIGRKSIVLVFFMVLSVLLSMKLLAVVRKKHKEYHVNLSRYSKEAAYISRQAIESSSGKDIRIYNMMDWFLKKYEESLAHMDAIFCSIHNWYFLRSISDALVSFVVDILAWGYLIYLLVKGQLTAAEFVLYLGLISGFSAYFETLLRQIMQFQPMSVAISYIRELLEIRNNWGENVAVEEEAVNSGSAYGDKAVDGVGQEKDNKYTLTVELCDVSYTYPGSDTPTLSHINLKIHAGEKLALLGLNGAGKTTLVKLICGFYQPTEGQILVNGRPVREYDREEYYQMISVLFQDATMLPVTLDRNLTGLLPQEIDREKLQWSLSMTGFAEKYASLPKQGESLLVREVNEGALDYSGGEKQKLLFSRALYKDAKLLILDEPTAALDPIAENELYQNFAEAAKGRTTIYISHRLSSTRFCDRIVLLENGQIIEEGTHDNLMQQNTRYAELFEIQSKYYKEQAEQIRRNAIMGDTYVENAEEKEGVFDEK